MLRDRKNNLYGLIIKRIIDIIFGIILLVLSAPLMLILTVWIKCDSRGPALFKQERIGKNGKPFTIYKFRSMNIDAPQAVPTSEFRNAANYITKSGQIMRKTSLDELPQLFNVVKGDMSFVGPRPLLANERVVHDLRHTNGAEAITPGITGLAQVHGRDEITDVQKANYDGKYAQKVSFLLDIKILWRTLIEVVQRRGIRDTKRIN